MQYGYFDNDRREYVINRVDTPASWTNYIGVNDYCAVLNQTAGGYSFYKSPQYHRVTRFRPNGVPLDRPGHYVYIRDDETGEYWSVSWQPVGKPLDEAAYTCRHGLSYSTYACDYREIEASQTVFVPLGDPVELWDVRLRSRAASIDLKADEAGLLAFCRAHGWPITFYSAEQLRALPGPFTPSPFVQSVTGVDNVCERAAVLASGGCIRIPKQAGGGVTFALALCPYAPDWRWQNG